MQEYACQLCRKSLVRWDHALCFKCWHKISYHHTDDGPFFEQLDLFHDSAVRDSKPLSS